MAKKSEMFKSMDLDLNYKYLFYRRTKIVATIGPASESEQKLRLLIKNGMNVARINFSHGNPADHVKLVSRIRKVAQSLNANVAILGDLCGPKIRVGVFKDDSISLKEKTKVLITSKNVMGDAGLIPSQYRGIIKQVKIGERILLDDGNLELKVLRKAKESIEAVVIRGGILKNNKGMNLPDTDIRIAALTDKDRNDVKYCVKADVDYISLSFVRQPQDIVDLKNVLKRLNADIRIIAKIEKPEALENIDHIIDIADGIMVARGDLGVEMAPQKVPLIQNRLITLANQNNKPVIVATQMMESMVKQSRPTRAEVSDVAGACLAGADAVMLSAETASGKYPVESLSIMDTVLRETEAFQFFNLGGRFNKAGEDQTSKLQGILGIAVSQLSRDLMVRSIFVQTRSGDAARMISSNRPAAPVFAVTQSKKVHRCLNLFWGVNPILISRKISKCTHIELAEDTIKKQKLGKKGDYIILLSGFSKDRCSTYSIEVHVIN